MTKLKRLKFTQIEANVIEAYRKATLGNDFSALLTAVILIHKHGIDEPKATQAIAMGYTVINEEESE